MSNTSVFPPGTGPSLGVLGGMGPAATADFLAKFAVATGVATDQEHFATLVYSDPTTPDRSDAMMGRGPSPLPAFLHGIEFLTTAGSDVLVIPCNSAHYWYEQIEEASSRPVIHIVDAVAQQVREHPHPVRTLGLMATDGTTESGVYSRLAAHGYDLIDLRDLGEHNPIMRGIREVKAGRLDEARERLTEAAGLLKDRGADGVIYGCTDISAVMTTHTLSIPAWDSATALAAAAVTHLRNIARGEE